MEAQQHGIRQWTQRMFRKLAWLKAIPAKATLLVACCTMLAGFAGVFNILHVNFAKPIEFRLRSALGKDPLLDPRIQMFAFDDVTASKLGRPALNFGEWREILTHLSKHGPRLIVIDQVFQIVEPDDSLRALLADKDRFPNLIAGAFSSERPVLGRSPVSENPLLPKRQPALPWQKAAQKHIYGPDLLIRPLFSGLGAINYSQNGQMPAALQSQSGGLFPTLGLTVAGQLSVSDTGLHVNGQVLPVSPSGELQANQGPLSSYFSHMRTMAYLLESARSNQSVTGIRQDSIVFLLPMMYTGSADFKSTPHGEFPGGLLHVAVANSALTNQWIRLAPGDTVLPLVAAVLAIVMSLLLTPFRAAILILGQVFVTVAAGLMMFVFDSTVVAWSEASAVAFVVGLTAVAEKARLVERKTSQIRHTLAGLVPPKLLGVLLQAPARVLGRSRRANVTVMFIDIEGFSLRMQNEDPDLVFNHLKGELGNLCETVQRYGGIVDKTLGDGLLCYFGYNFDPEYSLSDREHAFSAMTCALDIQINSAKRAIKAAALAAAEASPKRPLVFPLRIGINTGEVFIGNVGNKERIDLTIVGHAVNWAKRYEDVCESFRIMLGPQTKEAMTSDPGGHDVVIDIGDRSYTLYRRNIIVKHYDDKRIGWECNPFEQNLLLLTEALHAVDRSDCEPESKPISVEVPLVINGVVEGIAVSFGLTGATVIVQQYLSKRETIDIRLSRKWALEPGHALTLRATVLWGIEENGQSTHGLRFVDVSPDDRNLLARFIHEATLAAQQHREASGLDAHLPTKQANAS